jgi:hypothetical protein
MARHELWQAFVGCIGAFGKLVSLEIRPQQHDEKHHEHNLNFT